MLWSKCTRFKLFNKRISELSDQLLVMCIVCFSHIVDAFQWAD